MANTPDSSQTEKPEALADEARNAAEDTVEVEEASVTEADVAAGEPGGEDSPKEPEVAERFAEGPQDPAPETAGPGPAREKRRGGAGAVLGFVTGGILAAIIGFAAARYVVPEGWPFPGVPPKEDPVAAAVEAQETQLAKLEEAVAANAAAIASLRADETLANLRGEIQSQIGAVQAQIGALSGQIDEINARLAEVEKLAPGGSSEAAEAAAQAYERELADMRLMLQSELDRIKAAQADAAALEVNAAEAAKAAAGRAALARILAALDTGRPFDQPLFDLTEATGIEAPAALSALATEGAPTLAALQEAFPLAARAALDAAIRAAVENGSMNRFTAFLRIQLGTRSLEPREGDDPDAVLSRAEDALRKGQIEAALSELDAMPEAAGPALADWRALAATRVQALAASATLAEELNAK